MIDLQIFEGWQRDIILTAIGAAIGFFLFALREDTKERKKRNQTIDLLITELTLFDNYLSKALQVGRLDSKVELVISNAELDGCFPLDTAFYEDISAELLATLINPANIPKLRRTYERVENFNSKIMGSIPNGFKLFGASDLQNQIQETIRMLEKEKSLCECRRQ